MSDVIPSRHNWTFTQYDLIDKETGLLKKEVLRQVHIEEMIDIVSSMFDWQGLPETIKARVVEKRLISQGHSCFLVVEGKPYCVEGNGNGLQDVNDEPTTLLSSDIHLLPGYQGNYRSLSAVPLGINYTYLKEGEESTDITEKDDAGNHIALVKGDGVIIRNDSLYRGLMPFFEYTASLLVDAEITLEFALINNRVKALVTAFDDNQRDSWSEVWKDIVLGNKLGAIMTQNMSEFQAKLWPYNTASGGAVKEALEAIQYIWGSFFNKLGLQSNFNMKREAINSSETGMNLFALLPKVDDMLKQRQEGVEWLKKLDVSFANASVSLASGWQLQHEEAEASPLEDSTNEEKPKEDEEDEVSKDNA